MNCFDIKHRKQLNPYNWEGGNNGCLAFLQQTGPIFKPNTNQHTKLELKPYTLTRMQKCVTCNVVTQISNGTHCNCYSHRFMPITWKIIWCHINLAWWCWHNIIMINVIIIYIFLNQCNDEMMRDKWLKRPTVRRPSQHSNGRSLTVVHTFLWSNLMLSRHTHSQNPLKTKQPGQILKSEYYQHNYAHCEPGRCTHFDNYLSEHVYYPLWWDHYKVLFYTLSITHFFTGFKLMFTNNKQR